MIARLPDLCWEGLTLKHVAHRKIIFPYLMFVCMAFVFELFLVILFGAALYVFASSGFNPSMAFYCCGPVLILMVTATVMIFMGTIANISDCAAFSSKGQNEEKFN